MAGKWRRSSGPGRRRTGSLWKGSGDCARANEAPGVGTGERFTAECSEVGCQEKSWKCRAGCQGGHVQRLRQRAEEHRCILCLTFRRHSSSFQSSLEREEGVTTALEVVSGL